MDQLMNTGGLSLESIDQPLLTKLQQNGPTFLRTLNEIWASLMDDNISSIGIYGMGGVGKTTVAKFANERLLSESKYLPHVYCVTISQDFSIHKLQTIIARALAIGLSEERDEKKRAAEMLQALKNKERFVLIVDGVSKMIEMENIGIRLGLDGCKLVVTSRSLDVCHQMGCQKVVKVNELSEQEAFDLFIKKLDSVELSPRVEDICKKMSQRCHGLPLAVIVLAESMRGVVDIQEWMDVLQELNECYMGQSAGVENAVSPVLLYCFNRLKDPKLKSCFLYCSLYPQDYDIRLDELIASFISEQLMDVRLSRRAKLDQGRAMLNQLEKAHLVEICTDRDIVRMHDLIRDVALTITRHNPRYMVKAGVELTKIPDRQHWTEDLDKVSLMDNDIQQISPGMSPNCPRLSSLILSKNPLEIIPECFFYQMRGLSVLNLSQTSISRLPNSISLLENLNALLLIECADLVCVPPLEKLRLLQELDLSGTRIEELPQGMESLTNLKLLYLACCYLNEIPPGILGRFSHLQELTLPSHYIHPKDVEALKKLELFDGGFNSVYDLNRLIESPQSEWRLNSYHIIINKPALVFSYDEYCPPCKVIHFGENSLAQSSLGVVTEVLLPQDIEEILFEATGLSGCLSDYFPTLNNARGLKKCDIAVDDEIEYIMRLPSPEQEQLSYGAPFESLEDLFVLRLPNLISLLKWEGDAPVPPGIFSQLKTLNIDHCAKMKKLLQWSLLHNLHNLEKLDVSDCDELVEIIGDDGEDNGGDPCDDIGADIVLPKLKKLSFYNLPKLTSICKGMMSCDSIESIWIYKCRELKKVPLRLPVLLDGRPCPPPFLKEIKTARDEKQWWELMEWGHPNDGAVLVPFRREYW